MGWLKIQKLEYLESATQLFFEVKKYFRRQKNTSDASDDTFLEVIVL